MHAALEATEKQSD